MKVIVAISAFLLLGFISSASATKIGQPEDRVVRSPNSEYVLHIETKSGRHEIRKGTKVLWSFARKVWHDNYYLSNDGQSVLWVAWKHVKADDVEKNEALSIYSSEGVVSSKTFLEVSKPRHRREKERGPIGDFWRIWRDEKIARKGDVISIAVEGTKANFTIDLSKMDKLINTE
jgi:hypothetical protein